MTFQQGQGELMAQLFGRDNSVISRYLRNIFEGGELVCEATVAKNTTIQKGATRAGTCGQSAKSRKE